MAVRLISSLFAKVYVDFAANFVLFGRPGPAKMAVASKTCAKNRKCLQNQELEIIFWFGTEIALLKSVEIVVFYLHAY